MNLAASFRLTFRGLSVAGCCAGVLWWLAGPARALDFQLHDVKTVEDGFPRTHSCFRYDARTDVQIDLPRGWSVRDDAASISAVPPDGANTLVRVAKSSFPAPAAFGKTELDAYRPRVLATVPRGAVNTRIVEEKPDPLPVFGWKGYQFTLTYDFFGQALRLSVLFINLNPKEQLMVTIMAKQEDFEKVYDMGLDVLRSWNPVPAGQGDAKG